MDRFKSIIRKLTSEELEVASALIDAEKASRLLPAEQLKSLISDLQVHCKLVQVLLHNSEEALRSKGRWLLSSLKLERLGKGKRAFGLPELEIIREELADIMKTDKEEFFQGEMTVYREVFNGLLVIRASRIVLAQLYGKAKGKHHGAIELLPLDDKFRQLWEVLRAEFPEEPDIETPFHSEEGLFDALIEYLSALGLQDPTVAALLAPWKDSLGLSDRGYANRDDVTKAPVVDELPAVTPKRNPPRAAKNKVVRVLGNGTITKDRVVVERQQPDFDNIRTPPAAALSKSLSSYTEDFTGAIPLDRDCSTASVISSIGGRKRSASDGGSDEELTSRSIISAGSSSSLSHALQGVQLDSDGFARERINRGPLPPYDWATSEDAVDENTPILPPASKRRRGRGPLADMPDPSGDLE